MNQTKLNKYSRSVSIIGVGCTSFMYTVDNEETNGLTEGELYGYAALKAMEDAGITAKDVDYYFHGEASPLNGSNYLTPNIQIGNWFGMKGKGSIHHSDECCTGYLAIEQAVNAVAYGKYNENTIKFLKTTGYEMAFTIKPGYVSKKSNKYTLPRFSIAPYTSFKNFIEKVNGNW